MNQVDSQSAAAQQVPPAAKPDKHVVTVTVDGQAKEVARGNHLVSEFKASVGVPADYELDQVVDGEFKPLADDATLHIKGGEVFVSHVRRGGSS
ncbi:MAG: hypothetical protein C5B46_08700 [Proteobacteria bacterium]|nr:MAG: hypothetical protein C5B46_08700 [Pseudomonadota bacterium]